ncbi:MAG: CBS domain-containing protein [Deltaproteobacteria bacterium]|nr:CBS domain-containing protein [Deltaproteobacteria bacterium]
MSSIEPFTHRKIVIMHLDTRSSQAARAMCENRIGCVIVADERGHMAGIVTDRDLVCGLLAYRSDVDTPLLEVMTPDPATVDETAQLEDVLGLMVENGVRRIPVVQNLDGGKQRCVGIVTLDDLIASQALPGERISRVVQSQIFRSRGFPSRGLRKLRSQTRADARMEQTLMKFYKVMAKGTGLSEETVPEVTKYILSALVRRLHYTGAAHLIAQLPHLMQDDLLDLPAGPDRSVTHATILAGLRAGFGFTEEQANLVFAKSCEALWELVDPKQLAHVRAQLPMELQNAFRPQNQAA